MKQWRCGSKRSGAHSSVVEQRPFKPRVLGSNPSGPSTIIVKMPLLWHYFFMSEDLGALQKDWEAVGNYLSAAMQEIATELGGGELSERITLAAVSRAPLPNPDALIMLEELHPGSAGRVINRSEEIQRETRERELIELRKPSFRNYGKAILGGFASLNIWGTPSK